MSRPLIRTVTILPALWLASASVPAPAVIIRHDRTDTQALALAAPYTFVGRVSADGCGTLIAPTWVLTAAHVARGVSPFDPHVHFGEASYEIRRVIVHPDGVSREPGRPPRVDLALLELARPVEGIAPASRFRGDGEMGREVVIVGTGDVGVGNGDMRRSDSRRRACTNVIDDAGPVRLFATFDAPPAGTDLEGMGGPGDSGGPLLIVDADGVAHVAGVSSGSMGGRPGQYGTRDVYQRVSAFADWIDASMASPPAEAAAPPAPRDLVADGWPDTEAARLLVAFFDAFNSGDREKLIAFSRGYRLEGARRDRPDEAWANIILDRFTELGPVEPTRLADGARGDVQVEVRCGAEPSRTVVFRFLIQHRDGAKLDGLDLRGR